PCRKPVRQRAAVDPFRLRNRRTRDLRIAAVYRVFDFDPGGSSAGTHGSEWDRPVLGLRFEELLTPASLACHLLDGRVPLCSEKFVGTPVEMDLPGGEEVHSALTRRGAFGPGEGQEVHLRRPAPEPAAGVEEDPPRSRCGTPASNGRR